ncbi:MAG: amidohydrolase family protein [Pseudomonadota bacterium]
MLRSIFLGALVGSAVLIAALIFFLPVSSPREDGGSSPAPLADQASTNVSPDRSGEVTANSYLLTNARVLTDGPTGLRFSQPQNIQVKDGYIAAIGESLANDLPTVDGQGQYVIPGLIDAHTHSYASAFADAVRLGVTTHLDMFTNTFMLPDMLKNRAVRGKLAEADMFSSGVMATVPGGHGTQFGFDIPTLTEPDEAQAWVDARLAEGSDYIKLAYIPSSSTINSLDRATAKALIEAGHKRGVLVVAHIGTLDAARELVEDDIDGLVHIFADTAVTPEFIQLAVDKGIFIIPTLTVIASVDGKNPGGELLKDPAISPYLSPFQESSLDQQFGSGGIRGFDLGVAMANVKALHAAGVPILAGSDAPNAGTTYGATLHQEMALLVASGMPIEAALRGALDGPAKAFGLEGRGSLAAGSIADFVMLTANPLEDIMATREIAAVYKNGYAIERALETPESDAWTATDIGMFETDLSVAGSPGWTTTSDQIAGGQSTASVSQIVAETGAGSSGVMAVRTEIKPGFPFPWAGAFLGFSGSFTEGRNISSFTKLHFDVKGTPGTYRAMLFTVGGAGIPPTAEFPVAENWSSVTITLADVPGLQPKSTTGLALVSGPRPGVFDFELDNIRFEP